MRSVETTGKTIEEAKQKAVQELNVPEQEIEFEVLEVGAKGLFGLLGGAPARVRATHYEIKRHRLSSTQASPRVGSPIVEEEDSGARSHRGRSRSSRSGDTGRSEGRGRSRGEGRSGERQSGDRADSTQQHSDDGRARRDRSSQRTDRAASSRTTPDHPQPTSASESESRPKPQESSRGSRGARSSRESGRGAARSGADGGQRLESQHSSDERSAEQESSRERRQSGERQTSSTRSSGGRRSSRASSSSETRPSVAKSSDKNKQEAGTDKVNIEARSEEALALVNRILDAGELGARAQIATANASGNAGGKADGNGHDGIDIDIEGGDSALLVGRQGQCLDALQFLVGIIVNRRSDSRVRVTLDADGFRRKHRETLEATALDLAQQVIEHNQEAELEPLPARDRLIIHNVLKGHAGVYTYSEGEGEDRHVIISPKESE